MLPTEMGGTSNRELFTHFCKGTSKTEVLQMPSAIEVFQGDFEFFKIIKFFKIIEFFKVLKFASQKTKIVIF